MMSKTGHFLTWNYNCDIKDEKGSSRIEGAALFQFSLTPF